MTKTHDLLDALRVEPGSSLHLDRRETAVRLGAVNKQEGLARTRELVGRLSVLHGRLAAEGTRSALLVLQGMDTSGKDGTIRNVLTGLNPTALRVVSFREPTTTELAHDFLWRVHANCPARGEIGVFNRSHYEDVVAVRVRGLVPERTWRRRYEHIRAFENLLVDEGTSVVKVFLHVSRDTQRERLQERIDNPEKRWKFRAGDLADRERWDDFVQAYEEAISETSTKQAPWYVVPADRNWVRNLAVLELLVDAIERLDPTLPSPDPGVDGLEIVY